MQSRGFAEGGETKKYGRMKKSVYNPSFFVNQ
jgi:hypothetical protein